MSGKPLDFKCPKCGSGIGRGCVSRNDQGTWGARTHKARWRLTGIEKPSFDDLHRDYLDLKEKQLAARLALLKSPPSPSS